MREILRRDRQHIDTRRRRRTFRLLKKIQRISTIVLLWMICLAALYGVYHVVFTKPYFKVDAINVRGTLHSHSKENIISLSGIKNGDPLLQVRVKEIQRKLTSDAWIKEVAVHRKFPNMIWIYVKEHIPEAIIRLNKLHYVDRYGNIFKEVSVSDDKNYPVFTGLERMDDEGSKREIRSRILELIRVKKIYNKSFLGDLYDIAEIHFNENKGISIITLNDPMELRFGFGPFQEKIERFKVAYPAIISRGGIKSYADFSSEGRVVIKYDS